MLVALLSLLAGALSVLAPCVLPFLPVIVGGSVTPGGRRRPYLIAASLTVSLIVFTLLLKVSTALIGIDPRVWAIASGALVSALGVAMLLPGLWARISEWTRLNSKSHALLESAKSGKSATLGAVLTGIALGPVFSSCSPTYAWVIATVLPANPTVGTIYLACYCVGMAGTLLGVSLAGRKLISRLGWAANPKGWFQRSIAVLFIIVGILVATGLDKRVQTWSVDHLPVVSNVERKLVPTSQPVPREQHDSATSSGAAPEITGIQEWINSKPLKLSELRGQVVLVDFWTYSCINCIRTQPYLNDWYSKYHDDGFEIIGVHAPEFAFEKVPANVKRAVQDAHIRYPVALDNNFATWQAYQNQYWPAKYLVDKQGNIVWSHFGEGGYSEAEAKITELLEVKKRGDARPEQGFAHHVQSPETYLGVDRAEGFVGQPGLRKGRSRYRAADLPLNNWTLDGDFSVDDESIVSETDGVLKYHFTGREVFLVLSSVDGSPRRVGVSLNSSHSPGGADVRDGAVTVQSSRLYKLVRSPNATDDTLVLRLPKGVRANAFTFG
ncbi:redoxin domain-containing protein [Cutibacterium equinum]|uniref:Redoxin domain-containing protein n=1 Tax=Cutibacterium equinum TaxID=3016342 RepID=A0ABY7QVP8_9ACTN|nr:redoxin domain-containing protein [Cutibacterium equinum]WCC79096.1 redoxin domain-containing protein [Cutibacterium equinum]